MEESEKALLNNWCLDIHLLHVNMKELSLTMHLCENVWKCDNNLFFIQYNFLTIVKISLSLTTHPYFSFIEMW